MSRKVIQLGYLLPNDLDYEKAFWNVVKTFQDRGIISKHCGFNSWEISPELVMIMVSIDTAFLTPKSFNVELDGTVFRWQSKKYNHEYNGDLKEIARCGCVVRVEYPLQDGAPLDKPLGCYSPYIIKTEEKAHEHRFSRPYNVAAGVGLDWIGG